MIALKQLQADVRSLIAAHATFTGEMIVIGASITLLAIASVARASNVATIVTGSAHGLINGTRVDLSGITTAGFDVSNAEVTVINATTFTYANTGANVATTADVTGKVRVLETTLQETALEKLGHCVTIFPPIAADTLSQARGQVLVDASVVVRVDVNLERATKAPLDLVSDIIAAVLTPACQPHNNYRLDDPAIVIDDTDPGLLSYLVYFKRHAQF